MSTTTRTQQEVMDSVRAFLAGERKPAREYTDEELRAEVQAAWGAAFDAWHLGWGDQAVFLVGAGQALSHEAMSRIRERAASLPPLPTRAPSSFTNVGRPVRVARYEADTIRLPEEEARRIVRVGQIGRIVTEHAWPYDGATVVFEDGEKVWFPPDSLEDVPRKPSPVGLRAKTVRPEVESTAWNAAARARREGRWGQVGIVTALTGERRDTFVLRFEDGHKAPYEKHELQFDWLDLAL
jgi:hypothetical protein